MSPINNNSLLIGKSGVMQQLRVLIARVAPTDIPVLVTGETGVGKELVARTVHQLSGRVGRFVAANVCAVSESLFERALFGHIRGAYTGAVDSMPGLVGCAHTGTLFLDEIGNLRCVAQPSLLRVLETKEYSRVGEEHVTRASDFRLVSATNACLESLVATHGFRSDLLYRIRSIELKVASLRERREDIPMLAAHFASECATTQAPVVLLPDALSALREQPWPGNVRQLRAVVHTAVALSENGRIDQWTIEAAHPRPLHSPPRLAQAGTSRERLVDSLTRANGNRAEVAREHGVHLATVYRWMVKWQVNWPLRAQPHEAFARSDSHSANANSH